MQADKKSRKRMTIKEIPGGKYQSRELVDIFKKILFGMNKKNENVKFTHTKEVYSDFPFNELNSSTPFANYVDWEDLLKTLKRNAEIRARLQRSKTLNSIE